MWFGGDIEKFTHCDTVNSTVPKRFMREFSIIRSKIFKIRYLRSIPSLRLRMVPYIRCIVRYGPTTWHPKEKYRGDNYISATSIHQLMSITTVHSDNLTSYDVLSSPSEARYVHVVWAPGHLALPRQALPNSMTHCAREGHGLHSQS